MGKQPKNVNIIRNFTLTVARYISVILPGDFKVVHFNRYFTLTVFILTRFHFITHLSTGTNGGQTLHHAMPKMLAIIIPTESSLSGSL